MSGSVSGCNCSNPGASISTFLYVSVCPSGSFYLPVVILPNYRLSFLPTNKSFINPLFRFRLDNLQIIYFPLNNYLSSLDPTSTVEILDPAHIETLLLACNQKHFA